ncbi:MAG TPA: type II secretion system major pseudopilin GspG [Azospirillaceae bacterium]|nr:type II secretion system major pseudopilin GspG [Azospirillaceae bacterium]
MPRPPRPAPAPASREDGFTLIEILVVLVILGLLAGLVGPQVLRYLGGSKQDAARLQIQQLTAALDLYRLDAGRYPAGDQGLKALVEAPAGARGWSGPYLSKAELPLDPWGNPYAYRQPGQHGAFDLWSLGADGREGGEGEDSDVTSWTK